MSEQVLSRAFLNVGRSFFWGGDLGAKGKRKSAEKPQRRHVGERRSVRGEEEEEARSENVSFRASVRLLP